MLSKRVPTFCLLVLLVTAIASASNACGGENSPATSSQAQVLPADGIWRTQPPVSERLRGDGALVAAPLGETMDLMLFHAPIVVVVTIETYEDVTNSSDFTAKYVRGPAENEVPRQTADTSATLDPDYIPRIALFSATVDRTIAGAAATLDGTDKLLLVQTGGYAHGNAYEGELDPLLAVGKSYLLFVAESGTTVPGAPSLYSPSAMGKFEVKSDNTLAKVWPMDFGPAIPLLLNGKSLGEAIAIIEEGVRNYTPPKRE